MERVLIDARGIAVHRGRGIGRVIVELLEAMGRIGARATVAGPVEVRAHMGGARSSLTWLNAPARHISGIMTPGSFGGASFDTILRLALTSPGPVDARSVACLYDLMPLKAPSAHYPLRTRLRHPLAWPAIRRAFDLYPRARAVWTISQASADDAARMLGVARDRLVPIPLAAPRWARPATRTEIENVRRAHDLPVAFVLWVLSGTNANKNIDGMFAAAAAAAALGAPPLVVAGSFGNRGGARVARAAARAGATFRSIGAVSDEALRALCAAASCVAVPSLDEGYALPIAEAVACGGFVVANDIAVLRELAHPRVCFADATHAPAFASALLQASRAARSTAAAPARSWDDVARAVLALT